MAHPALSLVSASQPWLWSGVSGASRDLLPGCVALLARAFSANRASRAQIRDTLTRLEVALAVRLLQQQASPMASTPSTAAEPQGRQHALAWS